MSRTFKIQISDIEMVALIQFHTEALRNQIHPSKETAERIVELTRRLNKETPEIVKDEPKSNIKDEW